MCQSASAQPVLEGSSRGHQASTAARLLGLEPKDHHLLCHHRHDSHHDRDHDHRHGHHHDHHQDHRHDHQATDMTAAAARLLPTC